MPKTQRSRRGLATLSVIATAALLAAPASAQTNYNWIGNGAGGTNQSWTTGGNWDVTTGGPGSLNGGAVNDTVVIKNTRGEGTSTLTAQATETVRINNVDVGQIDTLQIGGYTNGAAVAPPFAGNWTTALQVRGNAGDIQINTLTLGAVDIDRDRGGQLLINNLGSSATVGTVVSGSTDGGNRITIGNNAAGGFTLTGNIDSAGTREIDLQIQANDDVNTSRVVLGTGSQLLSVDSFEVGQSFNGNNTGTFTLNDSNVVEANLVRIGQTTGNTMNMAGSNRTVNGTLTIDGGASVTSLGGSGQNGNVQAGFAGATYVETQTANGTINVEDGTLTAPNLISLGMSTLNATTTTTTSGTLNLNNANSVVNVGRINDGNSMLAGGVDVGQDRNGTGEININAGTLSSIGRVYVAGDATNGQDRGTTGTVNVNAGGTLLVGNVTASDLTYNGNARAPDTVLGNANLEVGRDGQGFLNVDGGTLTVYRGNLVLGQTGNDVNDEFNTALTTPLDNASRGTVTFSNGAQVTIGVMQGDELLTDSTPGPPVTGELLNDLNYNNGGGDITQSGVGTTVSIERNLNMTNAANENSYTISGGTLTVGSNASIQNNQFNVLGAGATITIGNDLTLNSNTNLTFDFEGAPTISSIDVGHNVDLDAAGSVGADLFLLNLSALATYTADILLIDAGVILPTGTVEGEFQNAPEGTVYGAYLLTYDFGGPAGGVGLIQIPEPSTLGALALGLGLLAGRRRRSQG